MSNRVITGLSSLAIMAVLTGCGPTDEPLTGESPTVTTEPRSEPAPGDIHPDSGWEVVEGDGYFGAITHGLTDNPEPLDPVGLPYHRFAPDWGVTADDVARFEAALPDALANADQYIGDALDKLDTYTRWYIGGFDEEFGDGRLLMVNMYCRDRADDWLTVVPLPPDDPGPCHIWIVYNVDNDTVDAVYPGGEN